MMRVVLTGRLGQDPVSRSTKSGAPMVTTSIAAAVNRPTDPPVWQWLNVAAFGTIAENLGGFAKGDTVTIAGTVTKGCYTTRDGESRENWNLTLDWILTAAEAPARPKRPAKTPRRQQSRRSSYSYPADDPVDDLWRDGAVS